MVLFAVICVCGCSREGIFIEAESFPEKGGWVVDQQSMDVLGSAYILAHGAGKPVDDASMTIAATGRWYVYVRTHNWTSPWSYKKGPGEFQVIADGKALEHTCGTSGRDWEWQYAGKVDCKDSVCLSLHDLTGFDGRVDALYLSRRKITPSEDTHSLRLISYPEYDTPQNTGEYDFVVIGGGISGICAAVTAARLGMKVAIINDRPVLGGNNSAEIRVHLGGRIELDPYPNLGNLIKEFGHKACSNAASAEAYADERKLEILEKEGVDVYMPYHACSVQMEGDRIASVQAREICSGKLLDFKAPLFADCTGDGTVGFLAGADYVEGREARSVYNESMAPEQADNLHLGASLLWNSRELDHKTVFPEFEYGLTFNDTTVNRVFKSEWYWETGLREDMIREVEKIRDFGLLAIYSNWSYLKNHAKGAEKFENRELDWVAYITGKRESRRLLGDHILTENDILEAVPYEDGTCSTSWSIDLHYYQEQNSKDFPGMEFRTTAVHKYFDPYPIPYRCLYSRNVDNLFMAGRDISCSHVAMGSVRVIRTCGMMGEVVGMAASICKSHNGSPRSVYTDYLPELKSLMREGIGQKGLPNDQDFCIHGCYPPKE